MKRSGPDQEEKNELASSFVGRTSWKDLLGWGDMQLDMILRGQTTSRWTAFLQHNTPERSFIRYYTRPFLHDLEKHAPRFMGAKQNKVTFMFHLE